MAKKSVKFMLGMMLGTAFGMAFAPKKGKELREELVKDIKTGKGEKFLKHNAKLVGKDVADTAKEVYQSKEVQDKIKMGKSEAGKLAKKVSAQVKSRAGEWTELAKGNLAEIIGEEKMAKLISKVKKSPAGAPRRAANLAAAAKKAAATSKKTSSKKTSSSKKKK